MGLMPGRDPQQHAGRSSRAGARSRRRSRRRCGRRRSRPGVLELGRRLVVPVHVDPRGVEAGLEGQVQLATRGHVHRQPLLGEQAQAAVHGNALLAYTTSKRSVRSPKARMKRAGALAHVVLGVHVGGRAELAGQLDHVAAADLQPARSFRREPSGKTCETAICSLVLSGAIIARIMKHAAPAPPELGTARRAGLRPVRAGRAAGGGRGDLPRRRAPPRRATSTSRANAGPRGSPRWPSTPAGTAAPRARSARRPSTTCGGCWR